MFWVIFVFSNISLLCRQIMGAHYRMDGHEGRLLGEIVAVRTLQQVKYRADGGQWKPYSLSLIHI